MAGLIGSWAMERAQTRISKVGSQETRERERASAGEPATYRVARAGAQALGLELRSDQEPKAGELIHYLYGAVWGALFGLVSRRIHRPWLVAGGLFGALLWLGSDELLVPLLGFSKPPGAYPPSAHLKALAAHVVYGTATAAGQRVLQKRVV